jgi:hypothetical protein
MRKLDDQLLLSCKFYYYIGRTAVNFRQDTGLEQGNYVLDCAGIQLFRVAIPDNP